MLSLLPVLPSLPYLASPSSFSSLPPGSLPWPLPLSFSFLSLLLPTLSVTVVLLCVHACVWGCARVFGFLSSSPCPLNVSSVRPRAMSDFFFFAFVLVLFIFVFFFF